MNNVSSISRVMKFFLVSCIVFIISIFSAFSQDMPKMKMKPAAISQQDSMNMQNKMMLPMAFYTHMGIPLAVGTYSVRLGATPTQFEGKTNTQFDFQFETGLSKTVGLFLGGNGLFDDPTLEAMVQFLVWKSKNGMNGISPIIEFEFPMGEEAKRSVYTLVGYAVTFSKSNIAFNQVLHYSPLEDLVEGSASLVIKASKRIFLVPEVSGVAQKGSRPISNLLLGVKVKLNKTFFLGIAYQLPLTENRDYSSRYVFQPNMLLQK